MSFRYSLFQQHDGTIIRADPHFRTWSAEECNDVVAEGKMLYVIRESSTYREMYTLIYKKNGRVQKMLFSYITYHGFVIAQVEKKGPDFDFNRPFRTIDEMVVAVMR